MYIRTPRRARLALAINILLEPKLRSSLGFSHVLPGNATSHHQNLTLAENQQLNLNRRRQLDGALRPTVRSSLLPVPSS